MKRSYASGHQNRESRKKKEEDAVRNSRPITLYCSPGDNSDDKLSTSSPSMFIPPQIIPEMALVTDPQPQVEIINQATESSTYQPQDVERNESTVTTNDPALWQVKDSLRIYYATNMDLPQNMDQVDLTKTALPSGTTTRCLTKSIFSRTLTNGESISRFWLSFSDSTNAIFCTVCKLFSQVSSQFTTGYNDWKNLHARTLTHENSDHHRQAMCVWIAHRNNHDIDTSLNEAYDKQCQYWKHVLERIVKVILFLGERSLALRGKDERFGSVHNGNYLGILELLSEYDGFLAKHIERFGNPGKGNTSYLSSTVCNELINIIGDMMLQKIVDEVKESKYFGIIVDSTPDLTHMDQLTFILRYVDTADLVPVERLLKFIPIYSHKGKSLSDVILDFLSRNDVDIMNCRSQSYDNASNMSGRYNGVQACIKKINPLADYVPCSAHSLNLVGNTAASCCMDAISFFGIVQRLYNFLSSSTHRWNLFVESKDSSYVVKSLSETRWSARHDAVRDLRTNYPCIIKTLNILMNDEDQTPDTRADAKDIMKKLCEWKM